MSPAFDTFSINEKIKTTFYDNILMLRHTFVTPSRVLVSNKKKSKITR